MIGEFMIKHLIKVANKIDSLGLTAEADLIDFLILKIAQESGASTPLVYTGNFFNDQIIKIRASIKGGFGDKNSLEELKTIMEKIRDSCYEGNYEPLKNFFIAGTEENKLFRAIDPAVPAVRTPIIDHEYFGFAVGKDIVTNSLQKSPIEECTSKYVKGEDEGIKQTLQGLIDKISNEKQKIIENLNTLIQNFIEEGELELKMSEADWRKKSDRNDRSNWSMGDYSEEGYSGSEFRGISKEEADSRIFYERAKFEERVKEKRDYFDFENNFEGYLKRNVEHRLTQAQRAWAEYYHMNLSEIKVF